MLEKAAQWRASLLVLFTKYYWGGGCQIKQDGIGGSYNMYDKRNAYKI
jgi:hypothetical protein